ncbi:unnamed protein product [Urochloa decumbens]|uniref:Dirigent protein n=1 Tax=Urochloa decumbens TaxID=240449 RepID=A0ABC9GAI7_9POAL
MATYSSFEISPAAQRLEYRELNFGGLYLHQTWSGPKVSQADIITPQNGSFGRTIVNNWEVYDGLGPDSKLVARAQGLHIDAGANKWHNTFSLVFEDGRFKGSAFQLLGILSMSEWAIVGGTGDLTMATGVVKKVIENKDNGNVWELTVKAFCPVVNGLRSTAVKIGPWGGTGGSALDITEVPIRLESIMIRSGDVVDSIKFSYIDRVGERRSAGPWGGPGGSPHTIQLDAGEFVREMSGTSGTYANNTVIMSLKIVTNLQTLGPWGNGTGTPFTVPVQRGSGIVGFFARGGSFLNAIGVYVRPN